MRLYRTSALSAAFALLAGATLAADAVPLAAHNAQYKLTLDSSRRGDVAAAGGTMAYEITDACDGWATRQRLQMTITNRDGQDSEMVSDYATWESKDGLQLRFRMRQTTDTAVSEVVEGTASLEATGAPGTVRYTVPETKQAALPAGTVFPMMHTAAILAAAGGGKRFVAIPIFDGTGDDGAQDSSVVITGWNPPASSAYPSLAALSSGRVRIAFYDRTKAAQNPDYEVGMRYWANGVADDLQMDFSDFVMQGKLSELTLPSPGC